jgi:putative hemolysin
MSAVMVELFVILLLIAGNGVLAMSELAILSARKARLEERAMNGEVGAQAALTLLSDQNNFLSTVQVGITLVGILAGTLGGATIAEEVRGWLAQIAFLADYSEGISVALVVVAITYFSLVIGELVPKRLALNNAEAIAVTVAPAMKWLAKVGAPLVALLSRSTDIALKLFGVQLAAEPAVTEEEVRTMIEQGTQDGVFEPIEEAIVGQVFRLSDRTVSALLTPRTDIVWLDVDDTPTEIQQKILDNGYSRYPVAKGNLDNVIGLVSTQDLLAQVLSGQAFSLKNILQPALFLPETTPALVVVERLKQTGSHLALVIDEYGGLEGLVTLEDVLSAIVGEIPDSGDPLEAEALQREDGSWLVDGMFQIDDFQELFEIKELPTVGEGYYQTVGGLVMAVLGRIPSAGDHFLLEDYRLEVMDMDGRRVDKVLVMRVAQSEQQ